MTYLLRKHCQYFKSIQLSTLKHKPFSILVFATASSADVDDKVDRNFLKRCMLPEKRFAIKHNLQTTKVKGNNIRDKYETTHTTESRSITKVITKHY